MNKELKKIKDTIQEESVRLAGEKPLSQSQIDELLQKIGEAKELIKEVKSSGGTRKVKICS